MLKKINIASIFFGVTLSLVAVTSVSAQVVDEKYGERNQLAVDNTILDVHRFWSDTYQSHFYTTSQSEKTEVETTYDVSVWRYEGVVAQVYKFAGAGRSPVYRFWSDTYQSHFYTINASEQAATNTNTNWKYENIAWYARKSAQAGESPVYRFWNATNETHFYTTDISERDNTLNNLPQWSYEGIAYYTP